MANVSSFPAIYTHVGLYAPWHDFYCAHTTFIYVLILYDEAFYSCFVCLTTEKLYTHSPHTYSFCFLFFYFFYISYLDFCWRLFYYKNGYANVEWCRVWVCVCKVRGKMRAYSANSCMVNESVRRTERLYEITNNRLRLLFHRTFGMDKVFGCLSWPLEIYWKCWLYFFSRLLCSLLRWKKDEMRHTKNSRFAPAIFCSVW